MRVLMMMGLALVLAGCSIRIASSTSGASTSVDEAEGASTMAEVSPLNERSLEIDAFNRTIEAAAGKEAWVRSPSQVARRYLGERFSTGVFADTSGGREVGINVSYGSGEENKLFVASVAEVTVTSDGLADDSVRGTRFRFEMVFQEPGAWHLTQAFESWRCWPGRGHQDYAAEPCR